MALRNSILQSKKSQEKGKKIIHIKLEITQIIFLSMEARYKFKNPV